MTDARHAVLELLLDQHPGLLSIEELLREMTGGGESFAQRDRISVAVRELTASGLVNRVGEFVFAWHAAAVADQLTRLDQKGSVLALFSLSVTGDPQREELAVIQKRNRKRRDGTTYSVWKVRWRDERGIERSKTFDKLGDARAYEGKLRTLKQTGALADLDAGSETLAKFVEEWWTVYAGPNLERATLRAYATLWNGHALARLGAVPLREVRSSRLRP